MAEGLTEAIWPCRIRSPVPDVGAEILCSYMKGQMPINFILCYICLYSRMKSFIIDGSKKDAMSRMKEANKRKELK